MGIRDWFEPLAPLDERVDHVALNRTGPDTANTNDDVVKLFGEKSGKELKLRPAFNLKGADTVGLLQSFVHQGISSTNAGALDLLPVVDSDQFTRLLDCIQHS